MKKSILTIAILFITAASFAQDKKDTVKKAPVKPKVEYKADPHRKYTIVLEGNDLDILVKTSQYGVMPYLKTTDVQVKQLDDIQKYFDGIYASIKTQYTAQAAQDAAKFRADTAKVKPKK